MTHVSQRRSIDVSVIYAVPESTFPGTNSLQRLRNIRKRATEDPDTVLPGAYRGVRPASRHLYGDASLRVGAFMGSAAPGDQYTVNLPGVVGTTA